MRDFNWLFHQHYFPNLHGTGSANADIGEGTSTLGTAVLVFRVGLCGCCCYGGGGRGGGVVVVVVVVGRSVARAFGVFFIANCTCIVRAQERSS